MALARQNGARGDVCIAALLVVLDDSAHADQELEDQPSEAIAIDVVNGYDHEKKARAQPMRLIATYDIDQWMRTKRSGFRTVTRFSL